MKNNVMKKVFGLSMAAVLTAGLLAGCGSDGAGWSNIDG